MGLQGSTVATSRWGQRLPSAMGLLRGWVVSFSQQLSGSKCGLGWK